MTAKKTYHGWLVVRIRTPSDADKGMGLPNGDRGTQVLKNVLADLLAPVNSKRYLES